MPGPPAIRLFAAVLLIVTTASCFQIETNLTQGPLSGFSGWVILKLANHSDREPNQPPADWNNVTLQLPYFSTGVQMTAISPLRISIPSKRTAVPAEITFYSVDLLQGILRFSFTWWGPPWTLYIGFSPS